MSTVIRAMRMTTFDESYALYISSSSGPTASGTPRDACVTKTSEVQWGSATLQDYGFPCTSQSHTTSACFALQSWHKRERSKGVSARWTCQRRRLSFVSKKFWTLGNAPHSKWLPSSLFEVPWAVTRPATRGGNRAIDTPEILCNVFSC